MRRVARSGLVGRILRENLPHLRSNFFYPMRHEHSQDSEENSNVPNKYFMSNMEVLDKQIFVGRDEFIADETGKIITTLKTSGRCAIIEMTDAGLGGSGKRSLAEEYSRQNINRYQLAWCINAATPFALKTEYGVLASAINQMLDKLVIDGDRPEPIEFSTSLVQIHERVKAILTKTPHWLLIFTNAPDEAMLQNYLPKQSDQLNQHVLVTSNATTFESMPSQGLGVLERGQSIELFRQLVYGFESLQTITPVEHVTLLCEHLGDLPLAIRIAAQCINVNMGKIDAVFEQYFNDFMKRFQEVKLKKETKASFPVGILVAIQVSISWITAAQPEMYPVINSIINSVSLLHPFWMSISWLEAQMTEKDNANLNDVINLLESYTLVKRDGQTLSIHPQIHQALSSMADKSIAITQMVRHCSTVFNYPRSLSSDDNYESEKLMLHALALTKFCRNSDYQSLELARLYTSIGNVYTDQGNHLDAIKAYERAHSIYIASLGPDHLSHADALLNQGHLHYEKGEHLKAIQAYESVKELLKTNGRHHSHLQIEILDILAKLYHDQRAFSEEISVYEEAKQITIELLGDSDKSLINILGRLGNAYRIQGRYPEALKALQEAKRITITLFGETHHAVGNVLNTIGAVYMDQHAYDDAIEAFTAAKDVRDLEKNDGKTISKEHVLRNLGNAYCQKKSYSEAIQVYEQILKEYKRMNLGTSVKHAHLLDTIADLYAFQKRYFDAQRAYEEARTILVEIHGINDTVSGKLLQKLGMFYQFKDNYSQAIKAYEEARRIFKTIGEGDEGISEILDKLGDLHCHAGNFSEAICVYEEAKQNAIVHDEESSDSVQKILEKLAFLYQEQKNYPMAISACEERMKILIVVRGEQHVSVGELLKHIGSFYCLQENFLEAVPSLMKAKKILKKAYGDGHLSLLEVINNLAVAHKNLKQYPEALAHYEEAKEIITRLHGPRSNQLAFLFLNVGNLYQEQALHTEAIDAYESAKMIQRTNKVEESKLAVDLFNHLGMSYVAEGCHHQAIKAYAEAKRNAVLKFGKKHASVAEILVNLGKVYISQNYNKQAVEAYEEAKKIITAKQGREDPSLVDVLIQLGRLYYKLDRNNDSIAAYEEAKRIFISARGAMDISVAKPLNGLAGVYITQGRYPDALTALDEAMRIILSQPGEAEAVHIDTLEHLGSLYTAQGRYSDAINTFEQVLDTLSSQGADEVLKAVQVNNLGIIYAVTGQFDKARTLFESAIGVFSNNSAKAKQEEAEKNLALSFIVEGNAYMLASPPNKEAALHCYQRSGTDLNPEKPSTYLGYVQQLNIPKDLTLAAECYRVLVRLEPDNGSSHYELARLLEVSAMFARDRGDMSAYETFREESALHYQASIRLEERVSFYIDYAYFLSKTGRNDSFEQAITALKKALSLGKNECVISYKLLHRMILDKPIQFLFDDFGKHDVEIKAYHVAYYLLIKLYSELGEIDKAEQYYQTLKQEPVSYDEKGNVCSKNENRLQEILLGASLVMINTTKNKLLEITKEKRDVLKSSQTVLSSQTGLFSRTPSLKMRAYVHAFVKPSL